VFPTLRPKFFGGDSLRFVWMTFFSHEDVGDLGFIDKHCFPFVVLFLYFLEPHLWRSGLVLDIDIQPFLGDFHPLCH